jgi:hypothetical protein
VNPTSDAAAVAAKRIKDYRWSQGEAQFRPADVAGILTAFVSCREGTV